MTEIEQFVDEIREIINSPRIKYTLSQDYAPWMMLCSTLDAIEDTDSCLNAFLTTDINFDSGNQHLDYGRKYIFVYGALQALFVQQDAVENMAKALEIPYTREATLKEIREIRNDSVGHPTKRGDGQGKAFNFISRMTINNQGFQLGTAYADGTPYRFKDVDIPDLITTQRNIHLSDLGDILETLKEREREMEHKNKFAEKKLADFFPPTLNYHLRKICEATLPEAGDTKLGGVNVEFILKHIAQFKTELAEREILEAYEGLTGDLELANYPLQELRKFFRSPDETHINEKDAYIFADFAERRVQELLESAKELDEEYGQDDPEEIHSR